MIMAGDVSSRVPHRRATTFVIAAPPVFEGHCRACVCFRLLHVVLSFNRVIEKSFHSGTRRMLSSVLIVKRENEGVW
jgi:hypothetical protein